MIINKIRIIISKSVFLKLFLSTIILILLILYFKVFFTTGVYFENTFLKKVTVASDNYYMGKGEYGSIEITVKGLTNTHKSADVLYTLPNNIYRHYIVTFKNESNWDAGIEIIKDEDGDILFSGGMYRKDFNILFDGKGEPLMEDIVQVRVSGQNPYSDNYKIGLSSIAGYATFSKDTIRGKYNYLVPALLILLITLIDIKFPLVFFNLRNMWDVRDPEPSDFYIGMQRLSWYTAPIISLILMVVAIS